MYARLRMATFWGVFLPKCEHLRPLRPNLIKMYNCGGKKYHLFPCSEIKNEFKQREWPALKMGGGLRQQWTVASVKNGRWPAAKMGGGQQKKNGQNGSLKRPNRIKVPRDPDHCADYTNEQKETGRPALVPGGKCGPEVKNRGGDQTPHDLRVCKTGQSTKIRHVFGVFMLFSAKIGRGAARQRRAVRANCPL